jgi:hypothetical protein
MGLVIVLTASCSKNNQPELKLDSSEIDDSWRTGQPCPAPCWYGLVPGSSSIDEVFEKTIGLTFIDSQNLKEDEYQRWNGESMELIKTINLPCHNLPNVSCVLVRSKGNPILEIVQFPHYSVTFIEFVEEFGTPDGFIAEPTSVEGKECSITLLWKSRQTRIESFKEVSFFPFGKDLCIEIRKNGNRIPPDLIVNRIIFMEENLTNELIAREGFSQWVGFEDK